MLKKFTAKYPAKILAMILVLCLLVTAIPSFESMRVSAVGVYKYSLISTKEQTISLGAYTDSMNYLTAPPQSTLTQTKGIFLKVTIGGASNETLHFGVSINDAVGSPRLGEVNHKVYVSDSSGTALRAQNVAGGFSGYVFMARNPLNDNLDLTTAVNKITFFKWDGAVNSITVHEAGYYYIDNSLDMSTYSAMAAELNARPEYAYEVISEKEQALALNGYGTPSYLSAPNQPTLENTMGFFFKIEISGGTADPRGFGVITGNGTFGNQGAAAASIGHKIYVPDSSGTASTSVAAGFSGYVFVPASILYDNMIWRSAVTQLSFQSWNFNGTLTVKEAGYYSAKLPNGTDLQSFEALAADLNARSAYDYEVISDRAFSQSYGQYTTGAYLTAPIPQTTLNHTKGIFLKLTLTGAANPLDFGLLTGIANIGHDYSTYKKIFVSGGTAAFNTVASGFSGYVFMPFSTGTQNLDITELASSVVTNFTIQTWTFSGTIAIEAAGYYYTKSYSEAQNYISMAGEIESDLSARPRYGYEIISDNYWAGTASNYSTIPYMASSVPAPAQGSSPKGIFFRLDVDGNAGGTSIRIVCTSSNTIGTLDGSTPYSPFYVSDDGEVTTRVTNGFKGYVFMSATTGTLNDVMPFTPDRLSVITDPCGSTWAGSRVQLSCAGYYDIKTFGIQADYKAMAADIHEEFSAVTYGYEVVSTDVKAFSGANYLTAYIKNPIGSFDMQTPKGVFIKLDLTSGDNVTEAMMDFVVELNDQSWGANNGSWVGNTGSSAQQIGNSGSNYATGKVFVAADGTVYRGRVPKNFKGYAFVPNGTGNASIPLINIEAIGFMMNNNNWSNVNVRTANCGLYDVSRYSGDEQYKAMARDIANSIIDGYEVISDFESAAERGQVSAQSPDFASGYTGEQALSGNGAAMLKFGTGGALSGCLASNIGAPSIYNAKGIFFRMNTNAPAGLGFSLALSSSYSISEKVFVSLNGTVTKGGTLPANFDGYVFVAANLAGNTSLNTAQLESVTFVGTGAGWSGITSFIDNLSFYMVQNVDDNEYLDIIAAITAKHPNNTLRDFYFTYDSSPVPQNMAKGIINKTSEVKIVANAGKSLGAINWVVTPNSNNFTAQFATNGSTFGGYFTAGGITTTRGFQATVNGQTMRFDFFMQILGDADFSGKIDAGDVAVAKEHLLKKQGLDMDGYYNSRIVSGRDPLSILDLLAIKEESLKPEIPDATTFYNKNTDWFKETEYGLMFHYLENIVNHQEHEGSQGNSTSWNACLDEFNTEVFAEQVEQTGAGYVMFSVMQNSRYMIAPNSVFERYTGYAPGDYTSTSRDLINDLYASLNPRGIKLMLYFTACGPLNDMQAKTGLGDIGDVSNNATFRARWEEVAQEFSQTYGTKISGWWIDGAHYGGYRNGVSNYTPNETNLGSFRTALLSGNSNAIIAFNAGSQSKDPYVWSSREDYVAGERKEFPSVLPTSRFLNPRSGLPSNTNTRKQWHMMIPLGHGFGRHDTLYKPSQLANYVKQISNVGGVISFDVGVYRDGTLAKGQRESLAEIRKYVGK